MHPSGTRNLTGPNDYKIICKHDIIFICFQARFLTNYWSQLSIAKCCLVMLRNYLPCTKPMDWRYFIELCWCLLQRIYTSSTGAWPQGRIVNYLFYLTYTKSKILKCYKPTQTCLLWRWLLNSQIYMNPYLAQYYP